MSSFFSSEAMSISSFPSCSVFISAAVAAGTLTHPLSCCWQVAGGAVPDSVCDSVVSSSWLLVCWSTAAGVGPVELSVFVFPRNGK